MTRDEALSHWCRNREWHRDIRSRCNFQALAVLSDSVRDDGAESDADALVRLANFMYYPKYVEDSNSRTVAWRWYGIEYLKDWIDGKHRRTSLEDLVYIARHWDGFFSDVMFIPFSCILPIGSAVFTCYKIVDAMKYAATKLAETPDIDKCLTCGLVKLPGSCPFCRTEGLIHVA